MQGSTHACGEEHEDEYTSCEEWRRGDPTPPNRHYLPFHPHRWRARDMSSRRESHSCARAPCEREVRRRGARYVIKREAKTEGARCFESEARTAVEVEAKCEAPLEVEGRSPVGERRALSQIGAAKSSPKPSRGLEVLSCTPMLPSRARARCRTCSQSSAKRGQSQGSSCY